MGGIVSEPEGPPLAALALQVGYGRPARSGINSFWTRTARALAQLGIIVLRVDYCREGETLPIGEGGSGQIWKKGLDLHLMTQVVPWFHRRVSDLPLLHVGVCAGARFAIELAHHGPAPAAGIFLIVPYLRAPVDLDAAGDDEPPEPDPVDPLVVEYMRAILNRAPGWVLSGERDTDDVALLQRRLGPTAHPLEREVVAGTALHFLDQPEIQGEAGSRLISRLAQAIGDMRGGS